MIEAVQQCNIHNGCEICRVSRIIEDLPCNTLEILHTFLKFSLLHRFSQALITTFAE